MRGEVAALVLAGSRRGEEDPVARAAGVPLKVLAPLAARPLLAHVLAALKHTPGIGRIAVVADEPARLRTHPHLTPLLQEGVELLPAGTQLVESVASGIARLGLPLLVTTGDHPLLEPRAIRRFLDEAHASGADLAAAVVPRSIFQRRFPHSRRTWWRFREDGYAGANLFLLRTPRAERLLAWWRGLESGRKRPWRVAAALGPGLLLGYLTRRLTLAAATAALSARLGLSFRAVPLDVPELAVDVDRPDDLALAAAILAARRQEVAG